MWEWLEGEGGGYEVADLGEAQCFESRVVCAEYSREDGGLVRWKSSGRGKRVNVCYA